MGRVLLAAGLYHLLFAAWVNAWPFLCFDWTGIERPNHPILWRGVGLLAAALGVGLMVAAKDPVRHWPIVLAGFAKFALVMAACASAAFNGGFPPPAAAMVAVDDAVWLLPFAMILWASMRAHSGVPPARSTPLGIDEASGSYLLSSGETLAEASEGKLLVLVFLRHFGCTFTRQILRGLESLEREAKAHGGRLVLVHMLKSGEEAEYLGRNGGVARIADPRCELYRAFGLGKGGFLELFGPRVWWRGAVSVVKGCGVGHLAGDGLQMPGAFLFRDGNVVATQRAHSASDLPDLSGLFQELPAAMLPDTVRA